MTPSEIGWYSFKQYIYVVVMLVAFLLQSTFSVIILNHGFHVAFVYAMLFLGIFLLPLKISSFAIFFFGTLTDIQSVNLNGIYLFSYFFSLYPIYFLFPKIKKALFFPTYIILFIGVFFLKTLIESFFIIIFYDYTFLMLHLQNSAMLEAVLSTFVACTIYGFARILFASTWLINIEK